MFGFVDLVLVTFVGVGVIVLACCLFGVGCYFCICVCKGCGWLDLLRRLLVCLGIWGWVVNLVCAINSVECFYFLVWFILFRFCLLCYVCLPALGFSGYAWFWCLLWLEGDWMLYFGYCCSVLVCFGLNFGMMICVGLFIYLVCLEWWCLFWLICLADQWWLVWVGLVLTVVLYI